MFSIPRSLNSVAPFAGAWIEIPVSFVLSCQYPVAPFAGAWIEITLLLVFLLRPSVAPFAGAWIEMLLVCRTFASSRRSLRGSVD